MRARPGPGRSGGGRRPAETAGAPATATVAAVEGHSSTFILVLALATGVVAQSLARRLHLPGIVVLLAAGVGLGPDGLAWVEPRALGSGLFAIVDLAVAVILFEGGLNLQISRLRREQAAIRRLITWGALITLLGGTLASRLLLAWSWEQSLLFASLVVVTGPTVIGPLVAELRLKPRVAHLLTAEGVLIDPIGAILAVLVLEITLAPDTSGLASSGLDLLVRMGFGVAAGIAAGLAVARLLKVRRLLPEGHENIFVLASVLLLFEGCDELVSHSGILAVTVAGVVVGNVRTAGERDLREFKDQLSVLLIGLLFVMLAADVRYAQVAGLGLGGLAVVAVLVLAVRPLVVLTCTVGANLSFRERIFVAWIAPRGIVAAAVAALVAGSLESNGIAGGPELRALVFLTIAATVLLAGLTAAPVGKLLRVRLPGRDSTAILGAHALGLALADELRAGGTRVIFLDANPQGCHRAEQAGYPVTFGNALEERTLQRARFELVQAAVALTANQTVNSVFVGRARDLFQVPEGYVSAERAEEGMVSELVRKRQAQVVFDGPHDIERWDVRQRHGDVVVEHRVFCAEEVAEERPEIKERLVLLSVRRGDHCRPMAADFALRDGDVVAAAIYQPERNEADRVLSALGLGTPSGPASGGA